LTMIGVESLQVFQPPSASVRDIPDTVCTATAHIPSAVMSAMMSSSQNMSLSVCLKEVLFAFCFKCFVCLQTRYPVGLNNLTTQIYVHGQWLADCREVRFMGQYMKNKTIQLRQYQKAHIPHLFGDSFLIKFSMKFKSILTKSGQHKANLLRVRRGVFVIIESCGFPAMARLSCFGKAH